VKTTMQTQMTNQRPVRGLSLRASKPLASLQVLAQAALRRVVRASRSLASLNASGSKRLPAATAHQNHARRINANGAHWPLAHNIRGGHP
jgi:hypothetical protein